MVLLIARGKEQGLLEDGVLVEAIDEKQLASLAELITEIKEINPAFSKPVNKDVKEIKSEYDAELRKNEGTYRTLKKISSR